MVRYGNVEEVDVLGRPTLQQTRGIEPDTVLTLRRAKVITFAFWETLATENAAFDEVVQGRRVQIIERAAARSGTPRSEALVAAAYQDVASKVERAWFRGVRVDNAARVQAIVEALELSITADALVEMKLALEGSHVESGLILREGAAPTIAALARRFQLVLISDTWMTSGLHLRRFLYQVGLSDHLTLLSFSDETGLSKMDGSAFTQCASTLGVRPSDIVHVGDLREVDVRGAQAAGYLATILFETAHHPLKFPSGSPSPEATARVNSFQELSGLLGVDEE